MSARATAAHWTEALRARGFDLVQAFDAASYNRSPRALGTPFRLPTFGYARPLGLVVAHGAALWQVFLEAVRTQEQLRRSAHPLDEYTESVVHDLQRATDSPKAAFFSHRCDPVIPIQRIADVAGLAGMSPSHLSVHPRVGPWLGLRAVVVFAENYEAEPAPVAERPCEGCSLKPCVRPFERARADARADWQAWLAVRDSCPVGRRARYGDPQIRYHYTKERALISGDATPMDRKVGEGP
ncbi:MAG TPA: hypothetical protein VFU02_23260 [Polyangiaceae bacterium]|nr:hypothetical protein [Polyangiaceae bacterium]